MFNNYDLRIDQNNCDWDFWNNVLCAIYVLVILILPKLVHKQKQTTRIYIHIPDRERERDRQRERVRVRDFYFSLT